jgi:outer membrane protein TolC
VIWYIGDTFETIVGVKCGDSITTIPISSTDDSYVEMHGRCHRISEIESDINQLSLLLAREPGALKAEFQTPDAVPPPPPEVPIGLPGDLARRRPDIRAAEADLHAATAHVGVAVAQLYPSITFQASLGTQAERFPQLAFWASRFFQVGPSIEIPIFEGGKLRATVHLQETQEREAAVDYAKTVLAAVHDVDNALIAYSAEQERRRSLMETEHENRRALELAGQRYRSGVTTFLDVLDAQRTLLQTELTLADSTQSVSTDLVALYKALGGGWKMEAQKQIRQTLFCVAFRGCGFPVASVDTFVYGNVIRYELPIIRHGDNLVRIESSCAALERRLG